VGIASDVAIAVGELVLVGVTVRVRIAMDVGSSAGAVQAANTSKQMIVWKSK